MPSSGCNIQKNTTVLVSNGCTSTVPVEITSCAGSCETFSIYSAKANSLMHSCSCCQEQAISQKEVEMICPNGSKTNHIYTYIESCGCTNTECAPGRCIDVTT
uniref:CTCK domain-containing protein n=1 Tax=Electrophorus electricus TaxID=8005 RepID=A0A4W4E725_ELEEL